VLRRAYWTRLWIIQEAVLSSDKTIHIGPLHLMWDALAQILFLFIYKFWSKGWLRAGQGPWDLRDVIKRLVPEKLERINFTTQLDTA